MKIQKILLLALILAPVHAMAGQPEARDVALANNCSPKKIEIYQNALGSGGETIYRVECNLPKTVGDATSTDAPNALLISCVQSMCELLRPLSEEKK